MIRWRSSLREPTGASSDPKPGYGTSPALLFVTLGAVAVGLVLELLSGAGQSRQPVPPGHRRHHAPVRRPRAPVARRYAGHPVARVLQLAGLLGAAVVLAGGHANAALFGPLPDAGAALTLWLSRWLWVPATAVATLGLLLLFPDGRLPSPRWRPAVALAVVGPLLLAVDFATLPFTVTVWQDVPVQNPVAVLPPAATAVLEAVVYPAWVVGCRRGSGGRRRAPAPGRPGGAPAVRARARLRRAAPARAARQLADARPAGSPRWPSPSPWPSR